MDTDRKDVKTNSEDMKTSSATVNSRFTSVEHWSSKDNLIYIDGKKHDLKQNHVTYINESKLDESKNKTVTTVEKPLEKIVYIDERTKQLEEQRKKKQEEAEEEKIKKRNRIILLVILFVFFFPVMFPLSVFFLIVYVLTIPERMINEKIVRLSSKKNLTVEELHELERLKYKKAYMRGYRDGEFWEGRR